MHELCNAVSSFGKLLVWDRVKTTEAAVVVKVRIDLLKDVPAGIVVSDANLTMSHSWTCPTVIFQNHTLGGPLNEEDPIPEHGNPHPSPQEEHHHPNQDNIVVGPAAFHLVQHLIPVEAGENQQHNMEVLPPTDNWEKWEEHGQQHQPVQ